MSLEVTMMDSTCTIYRSTSTSRDANQGQVQNFEVIAAELVCSQQGAGVQKQLLYAQRNASIGTTLYFYVDPGTTENDRLDAVDFATGALTQYLIHGTAVPVWRGVLWSVDAETIETPYSPATVVLPTATAITDTTAVLGGDVVSDGNGTLTEVGVVYSRSDDSDYPRLDTVGAVVLDGALVTGTFTLPATGLDPSTSYSFAPFATVQGVGTTYGPVTLFETEAA